MANHLFLIGIDNYLFQNRLNNCVKDLIDFKELLMEKYDFEEDEVVELYNGAAINRSIQDALISYARTLSLHDNLVIYFSGHGHYDKSQERGFWIPADGTHSYTTWISNETIITLIGRIECKHIFLISDSCFSNSVFIQNPTKGFNDYSKHKSRWALTSAFHEAFDSEKGKNGPFAKAILEFLTNHQQEFRVGELIEYVKNRFSADEFQSPQGSALFCKGHSGGEMIFQVKQQLDNRGLKGYNDFKKALQLYKRKSSFVELECYIDKSKKIGLQIFQEVDPVIKKKSYYLYLYEGCAQNQTYKYLLGKHPEIFNSKNLVVFLARERGQFSSNEKLARVSSKFKPISIFFIDDFIREQCSPSIEIEKSNYLNISNFILPSFSSGLEEDQVQEFIQTWFSKENEPILAIKGTGGIGKTTFAQYVADLWIQKSPSAYVIFIDSVYVKDVLMRDNVHLDGLKIYDFYNAFCEISGVSSTRLNEELFRLNMDAGNILIVIDGLDEVISKIPHFKINTFLTSIQEVSNELASGKVVITCRTHFWDNSGVIDVDLLAIELEPFNIKQTAIFFEKSLVSKTKVKKALKIAEQFKYPGTDSDNQFHPYVLDIVRSIVSSDKESIEIDLSQFSSQILSVSVKNDYIIYRICDRERKRIGQISVDEQVKFFIFLATEKRGVFKSENFKALLEESLGKKVDSAHAISFKSHPFVNVSSGSANFKYDFLSDLFKSIYISNYFDFEKGKTLDNNTFLELVEENCWFGSPVSVDVINRLKQWGEYDVLLVADLIKSIGASGISQERKHKAIGNIFGICLAINHKFRSNDIESNTNLLISLFDIGDKVVANLSITNIDFENHIRFDFSGLVLTQSYFNNYGSFWDCKFDEKTKFKECWLLNLRARSDSQIITKDSFIDCFYDRDLEEALRKFSDKSQNRIEQAKEFLNDFFHLFFSSGKLGRQWEHKIIEPRFSGISRNRFSYNQTIKILKSYKVLIVTKEKGTNKFAIADDFKEDVVRFTKDGTISKSISNLILDLANLHPN